MRTGSRMREMRTLLAMLLWPSLAAAAINEMTPLLNEQVPCLAQNLRETDHYICDEENRVHCLNGWTDEANACRTPVCQFRSADNRTKTCEHGECVRPNNCACKVGWQGAACDECIPLPGCEHGHCESAYGCVCDDDTKWKGAQCDIAICKEGCQHGHCADEPGECICEEGWKGELCDECITLPGCDHGSCGTNPLQCVCDEGWMGPLCDCPICRDGCSMEHGYCTNEDGRTDECLCHPGWRGANCTECIPYPGCPKGGTCSEPWECDCPEGVTGEACGHDRVHNLLPEYFHYEMSETCCEWNKEGYGKDREEDVNRLEGNRFGSNSDFSKDLVFGDAINGNQGW